MDHIFNSNYDTNANRFITSYNKIDEYLRKVENDDKWTKFSALVDTVSRSDSKVRAYANDLRQFANLRNAIVHSQKKDWIIAEPNDWAVNRIEKICEEVLNPPLIIPKFARDVFKMDVNDNIGEALTVMYEKEFSQVPVYDEGSFVDLLTANTIARWLGAVVAEDVFSLKETLIKEVLNYSEYPPTYGFMRRNMNVYDVLQRFSEYSKEAKKLDAILITEHGNKEEKLIGIITVYDLIDIQRLL